MIVKTASLIGVAEAVAVAADTESAEQDSTAEPTGIAETDIDVITELHAGNRSRIELNIRHCVTQSRGCGK